jgi:hypothetical protein
LSIHLPEVGQFGEAAAMSLPAYGFEINLLHGISANSEFTNTETEERRQIINELRESLNKQFRSSFSLMTS